jgi:hypothetical protein
LPKTYFKWVSYQKNHLQSIYSRLIRAHKLSLNHWALRALSAYQDDLCQHLTLHSLLISCRPHQTGSFIYIWQYGVLTQGCSYARKAFYHLSHPQLFLLYLFLLWVSCLRPGQHGLHSSYLCFLCSWNDRHMPPCPTFIYYYCLRQGVSQMFWLGWPQTTSRAVPSLHLQSS